MHSFRSLLTLLAVSVTALAPLVHAIPSPTIQDRGLLTNPQDIELRSFDNDLVVRSPMSNAQRMRRGLAPNYPKRFHVPGQRLQARQSSAPSQCTAYTGVIAAQYTSALGVSTGYLDKDPNSFGEFAFTGDVSQALQVSFCETDGDVFSISTLNGVASYPFLTAVRGYSSTSDDITGSNYAYVGAGSQTSEGAHPGSTSNAFSVAAGVPEPSQSDIWTVDSSTHVLGAHWVNSDGSSGPYNLVYVPSSGAFAIVADVGAFTSNYGDAYPATFTFVSN